MVNIFLSIFFFFLGLIIGSFLNCVIYRLGSGDSFLKGRSFCPHCRRKIFWFDLIPICSFLFLKGKCRHCGKKISLQYPLVELAAGLLFVSIFNFQFSIFNFYQFISLIYSFIISCFLIIIFVYDLKHYLIPDKVIFPAIATVFLYRFFEFFNNNLDFQVFISALFAAVLAASFFLFIFLISKGKWIGFGDVKLAFFLGLFLSWPNILAGLFFSFFFGALTGIFLIILKKKTLKSEVPFAPFLAIGTLLAFFIGETFMNWYFAFAF